MRVEILVYDRTAEERQAKPQFGPHPAAVDRRVPGNDSLRQAGHAAAPSLPFLSPRTVLATVARPDIGERR